MVDVEWSVWHMINAAIIFVSVEAIDTKDCAAA